MPHVLLLLLGGEPIPPLPPSAILLTVVAAAAQRVPICLPSRDALILCLLLLWCKPGVAQERDALTDPAQEGLGALARRIRSDLSSMLHAIGLGKGGDLPKSPGPWRELQDLEDED
jgi:hypothetical protein